MRTVLAWSDRAPEREGAKNVVYDIAFRPDGGQLVAAVGMRVLVYDAVDGDLLHSLKGHKDAVYCVAYAKDGKRFASGGADKQVIIWTAKAEGILKYAHTESIQTLCYNPMTHQLASATAGDFGLWSAEAKSVPKHKLPARACCSSWTNDGQHIALGLYSGHITIRDRMRPDVEKVRIERSSPVWSLSWNPSREEHYDVLAVACWDRTLSFYQLSGRQVGKERELSFDPCCVSYFANGEYVCLGGSDRGVALWTKDGVRLTQICHREDWVWVCRPRPKHNFVAVGCNDGTVAMYQLQFNTVHGLYQDRYAYRDYMTDVIVQHLMTDEKVRIKCRDYVKKIAVYKDRLAVQLPERILVYELANADDATDMSYRPCERVNRKLECNLLVVTSVHIILCHEKKLQLFDYKGTLVREWVLEATIRYIKVIGGERGREGLLVGLESGAVTKLFVDNPFPVQLIKQPTAVRCLDLSPNRKRLAVVDENATVFVYDLETGELQFQESNANSVAWNTELDDMLCFSGNGTLSIKTASFPLHQQKLQGFVVGFKGSKIFCLHYVEMKTIDVPQSASLYQYLEQKDFAAAYRIACLGVTDADWRQLGTEALRALELKVARQAFIRVKDVRFIDLVRRVEQDRKASGQDAVLIAGVLAHQGKYQEAARAFVKAGKADLAIQMYSDLHKWDEARALSGAAGLGGDPRIDELEADRAEQMRDWETAYKSLLRAGKALEAIKVIERNKGSADVLADLMRGLPVTSKEELAACAAYFKATGATAHAKEAYAKLDDVAALVALAVEGAKWDEALSLARKHPQFSPQVYLPYADWLALQDRFVEAQDAYKRGGRPEQSVRMLEALADNAISEGRHADAGYYLFLLAGEKLKHTAGAGRTGVVPGGTPRGDAPSGMGGKGGGRGPSRRTSSAAAADPAARTDPQLWPETLARAELYYAYALVHRYSEEPFTTEQPDTIFQTARFLMTQAHKETPRGVSKVNILSALAKQARALGANKLSRFAFDKLAAYRLPPQIRDQVELQALSVRARPFTDAEDLLPVCYRCQTTNPLLNSTGDECVACKHPFVRSFATFEPLPLVQFALPPHIFAEVCHRPLVRRVPARTPQPTANLAARPPALPPTSTPQEALRLIAREPPPLARPRQPKAANPWREEGHGGAQVLSLGGDDPADDLDTDDPFMQALLDFENGDTYQPAVVDEDMLLAMRKEEVFVQKWPDDGLPWKWWKNMVPEIAIAQCSTCNHFFQGEEWEFAVLSKGACPFCRSPQEAD